MRKSWISFCLCVVLAVMWAAPATAEIDQKTKVFLTTATYGTAAGALLGLTSLVFRNKPRRIAQGASLGLYAGLIFGAYVIYTHEHYMGPRPNDNENYYPDAAPGPYGNLDVPRDRRQNADLVLAHFNLWEKSF
ncbi:MAG: hypothetical protein J6Y94_08520 [Bacteriovoracaceae bacterium]|nr:hypothetical protein [Bacteriovoracaceae bacterium]